jgi:hypothetical protein
LDYDVRVRASTFKLDYSGALAIHRNDQDGRGNSPVARAISGMTLLPLRGGGGTATHVPGTHRSSGSWHPFAVVLGLAHDDLAHIAVFDMETGAVQGCNPDVRLPRTAPAIVDPAVES